VVAEGMWVQVCLMRERRLEGGGCVTFSHVHFFCHENPKISSNHTL